MACTDALWHTHVKAKDLQGTPTGLYQLFNTLFPNQTSKINNNPPFRMLHDGAAYLTRCYMLDACYEACEECYKCSLEDWMKKSPTWEEVQELSIYVHDMKIAGPEFDCLRLPFSKSNRHDKIHENQLLANHDLLLYAVLADAMNLSQLAMGCVTDFRPILGNPVEVAHMTSPGTVYISHTKGTYFPLARISTMIPL